jgi:hypothetical protein
MLWRKHPPVEDTRRLKNRIKQEWQAKNVDRPAGFFMPHAGCIFCNL